MQPDVKSQKLLECKARAFDSIRKLRYEIDSHRNFHRLAWQVICSVEQFEKQLRLAPTSKTEQFPCMCPGCKACLHTKCVRDATCEGVDHEDDMILLCDECANVGLHSGTIKMVEEKGYNAD